MVCDRGKYVMSVELALQREKAYRQKLEALQLQQGTSSLKCRPSSPNQTALPSSSCDPRPPSQSKLGEHPSPAFSPSPNPPTLPFGPRPHSLLSQRPLFAQRPTLIPNSISSPWRPTITPRPGTFTAPMPRPKLPPRSPTWCPRPSARPILRGVTQSPRPNLSLLRPTLGPRPPLRPTTPFTLSFRPTVRPTSSASPKRKEPTPSTEAIVRGLTPSPRTNLSPLRPTWTPRPPTKPIITFTPSLRPTIKPTPGPSHKRKEAPNDEQIEPNPSGKTRKLYCKVCGVHCSSDNNLQMHFMGHKHKSKVAKRDVNEKGVVEDIEVDDPKLHCDLCGIWCINEFSFRQHVIGKSHNSKRKLKG